MSTGTREVYTEARLERRELASAPDPKLPLILVEVSISMSPTFHCTMANFLRLWPELFEAGPVVWHLGRIEICHLKDNEMFSPLCGIHFPSRMYSDPQFKHLFPSRSFLMRPCGFSKKIYPVSDSLFTLLT